jgi:hypothetical protein
MLERLDRPAAIVVEAESDLAGLAREINAAHDRFQATCRAGVDEARRLGQLLVRAKASMSHGRWHSWVKSHCHFTLRTAERYMRLARNLTEIPGKTDSVSNLTETKVLSLLVETIAPDEPDEDEDELTDPSPAAPNEAAEGDDASDDDGADIDGGKAQEGDPSETGRGSVRVDGLPQADAPADVQEETVSSEPAAEENPAAAEENPAAAEPPPSNPARTPIGWFGHRGSKLELTLAWPPNPAALAQALYGFLRRKRATELHQALGELIRSDGRPPKDGPVVSSVPVYTWVGDPAGTDPAESPPDEGE